MPTINRFGTYGGFENPMLVPTAGVSEWSDVVDTATLLETEMEAADIFLYTCDVESYLVQGDATVEADAAAGSMFVPARMPLLIDGAQGARLSVIRKGSTSGICTLQKMEGLR